MLAVLAPRVVFAADAGDHVEEVDVAATVGVAVALAVWAGRVGETAGVSEGRETVPAGCPLSRAFRETEAQGEGDLPPDTQGSDLAQDLGSAPLTFRGEMGRPDLSSEESQGGLSHKLPPGPVAGPQGGPVGSTCWVPGVVLFVGMPRRCQGG